MPQNKQIIPIAPSVVSVVFDDKEERQRFLLLKYGKNKFSKDDMVGEFDFSPEDADAIIADFSTRGKDVVVDYEHATLTGDVAPAAGWIEALEKGEGGLYAVCRWTDKASAMLSAREYRYFSPVLFFDKKGKHPKKLHSVALTNHPALHGYEPLAATDDNGIIGNTADGEKQEQDTREAKMKELLEKLATAMNVSVVQLDDGEGIDENATTKAIEEAAKNLLVATDNKDKEIAELKGQLASVEAEKAVEKAFADRKLTEGQRAWAMEYARQNPEGFKTFCDAATAIVPGPASSVPGQTPSANAAKKLNEDPKEIAAYTDADKRILGKCGISDEDINKKEAK